MKLPNLTPIITEFTATEWAQIISAVGTMIAAVVAVIAAVQSYKSAKQNNATNEQMIRPRVIAYIDSDDISIQIVNLVIRNDGGGVARNVNLSMEGDDHDVEIWVAKNGLMSGHVLFEKGIELLPSHSERKYSLMSLIGQYDELLEKEIIIKLEYMDSTKTKKYSDLCRLDFASLPSGKWSNKDTKAPSKVAEELEKIRRILDKK